MLSNHVKSLSKEGEIGTAGNDNQVVDVFVGKNKTEASCQILH